MSPMRRLPAPLDVYLHRRTWAEALWGLVGLPLGIAGFVITVVTISVSAGLLITFVGLPLLAVSNRVSRSYGSTVRSGANRLLGTSIEAPPPFRRGEGLLGWLGSCLRDGTAWRARLYMVLKLPLGILGFTVTVLGYAYGFGGVTYPVWRPFLPCNHTHDGRCHRAIETIDNHQMDTVGGVVVVFLMGVVALLVAPWLVRAAVGLDRLVMSLLLGPTAGGAQRVEQLERTRAAAVDDSAATLRRIERDLHDGAQARLVALAMNVGLAREKVAEGGDPAEAARLLDTAHATAKEAIVELRDLARGIHPPVLDAGLDTALATLAANSSLDVAVRCDIRERPEPAIETMAYFCAAELLTNATKHGGARRVDIDARTVGTRLRLTVRDDGGGGAVIGAGSGLRGLADRVGTVDGTLTVDSPAGGPTNATVEVPLRTRKARS